MKENANKSIFSVIIIHYRQFEYVKEALDSVFLQSYPRIELIIADDASPEQDKSLTGFKSIDDVRAYIEKHKSDNIIDVKYALQQQNVGTVKNLNDAIRQCTGDYVLTFAADDALFDGEVLNNFYEGLSHLDDSQYMVSAQAQMMDMNLNKPLGYFCNVNRMTEMNHMTALGQYKVLTADCFYGMGATAYKRSMFDQFGYFDERLVLIEDWPYFLKITFNGSKITYINFVALKHRDGGVSKAEITSGDYMPPHIQQYSLDYMKTIQYYIIEHIDLLSIDMQISRILDYRAQRDNHMKVSNYNPSIKERIKTFNKIKRGLFIIVKRKLAERIKKWAEKTLKYSLASLLFASMVYIVLLLNESLPSKGYSVSQEFLKWVNDFLILVVQLNALFYLLLLLGFILFIVYKATKKVIKKSRKNISYQ